MRTSAPWHPPGRRGSFRALFSFEETAKSLSALLCTGLEVTTPQTGCLSLLAAPDKEGVLLHFSMPWLTGST